MADRLRKDALEDNGIKTAIDCLMNGSKSGFRKNGNEQGSLVSSLASSAISVTCSNLSSVNAVLPESSPQLYRREAIGSDPISECVKTQIQF